MVLTHTNLAGCLRALATAAGVAGSSLIAQVVPASAQQAPPIHSRTTHSQPTKSRTTPPQPTYAQPTNAQPTPLEVLRPSFVLRQSAAATSEKVEVAAEKSAAAQTPTVTVTGDVTQPQTLSASDLAAFPRATVTTTSNGISTVYAGVWLFDVLRKSGVPVGAAMRGKTLSGYVVATATDGYQVLFSLGEVDQDLSDGQYLLADTADGKALFGENGAFRLVVPNDKRGARSIRMLASLKVTQLLK